MKIVLYLVKYYHDENMIYSIVSSHFLIFLYIILIKWIIFEGYPIMDLDVIDLKILKLLQEDARLSNQDLADLVHLSASACHRRVKILESNGIIEKYQAKINYAKLGIKIEAMVEIKLAHLTDEDHHTFMTQIRDFDEVINVYIITGESNYVLWVATKDLDSFSQFIINKLNKIKGIMNINSKIVLKKVVQKSLI